MKTASCRALALLTLLLTLLLNGFRNGLPDGSSAVYDTAGAEADRKTGVSRCLVIGYDQFVSMPEIAPCSANNAAVMTALLADFVPDVTTLMRRVNSPGTVAGLAELIRSTFRESREEDTCWLYMSTHGVAWEEDGETRMALMLSDGRKEEALSPAVLKQILDEIPGEKVLILDACHSGALAEEFSGPEYRVLASSAAEEDSYFWRTGPEDETGTGYFTGALENALRASTEEQIDPDGNGEISMEEVTDRLEKLYGASSVTGSGADRTERLFRMPEKRESGERLRGLTFEKTEREEDALILPLRFTAEEAVRVEYRIVLKRDGEWDFEHSSVLPDRERTGTARGLLSPGEKERRIRISVNKLEESGMALLMVVSLRGIHGQVPVLEGTGVIAADP